MTEILSQTAVPSRRAFLGYGLTAGAATLAASPAHALLQRRPAGYPQTTAFLDDYVTSRRLPGVVAAIGRGQAAPTVIARGTLATDSRVPVDIDTLWRIYSMTKPITGIAAMQLVDTGRLTLDQPISDILPAFTRMQVLTAADAPIDSVVPATTAITIRHLLTHTAGLGYGIIQTGPIKAAYDAAGIAPGVVSRMDFPGITRATPAPSLAIFADRLAALPLVYQPGTRWSYSVSLDLLGRIIEVVSGMPFDAYLQARLFGPLGMSSTAFRVSAANVPRFVSNYAPTGGMLFPIDPGPSSIYLDAPAFPFGGAGLVTSARDYDKFLHALMNEGMLGRTRILSRATARLAMSNLMPAGTSTTGTFAAGQGFGAGGRVSLPTSPEGAGIFGWGGAAGTVGFVDRRRQLRFGGYAQYMPSEAYDFQRRLPQVLLADFGR